MQSCVMGIYLVQSILGWPIALTVLKLLGLRLIKRDENRSLPDWVGVWYRVSMNLGQGVYSVHVLYIHKSANISLDVRSHLWS